MIRAFGLVRGTPGYTATLQVIPARQVPDVMAWLLLQAHAVAPGHPIVRGSAPGHARLADCWLDCEDPEAWESLVQLAVQQAARHSAVAELVAICSEPLLAAALQRRGFIARSSRPLLVRANGVRLPAAGIRIQMLDDDTAYRHGGSRNFWV